MHRAASRAGSVAGGGRPATRSGQGRPLPPDPCGDSRGPPVIARALPSPPGRGGEEPQPLVVARPPAGSASCALPSSPKA
uniref:Uncharacterized protein n=1 Tax=Oryza sativa subsp. japonica TaxID=39947 RepID=Q6Z3R7_ORYSJ|nr:hypothetical protein [Oryza sativa Japonica Group]